MTIDYKVTGAERKKLVSAIEDILETKAKYLGVPSCAYQIGSFTLDKTGTLTFDDGTDEDQVEILIEALMEQGFEAEIKKESSGLIIGMPRSLFTESALFNLQSIVEAKGHLIKKALGIDELPIDITNEKVSFPWFKGEPKADEVKAYSHFVSALCEMARTQKRITAKEKEVENEKYAFRCFLLRLGFIGTEYKEARKILLRNLTGNSAFKSGQSKEV
jgi:hypothetical protein